MDQSNTRREALAEGLEALETQVETPQVEAPEAPLANETQAQAEARARDERGRFAPKTAAPQEPSPTAGSDPVQPPAAAAPRKAPSSWKKDYWESFGKIAQDNPALADYIEQREQQFASGVSTYKQEAERAKPLLEAIAPFQQELDRYGIPAHDMVRNLFAGHQRLVQGGPAEKIQMFAKLASDYGVSVPHLVQFLSGDQSVLQQLPQPVPQAPQPVDIKQQVRELLAQERMQAEIQGIASDKEHYPHFDAVRETMAGLLQAGLAEDLPSAYRIALTHPRHADLADAERQQREAEEAARAAEAKKAEANRARANNLSPRSATPAAAPVESKKDRRSTLEAAVDQYLGGGRV